jgi:acyl-CoA thioesterase FadM
LVHGGFLGVFFDCVVQHHNCATAPSGMTRTMSVAYRRPVPLLTELRFDVTRAEVDGKVTSTARLHFEDEVLCVGEVDAVVIPLDRLTGFAFGSRRTAATS